MHKISLSCVFIAALTTSSASLAASPAPVTKITPPVSIAGFYLGLQGGWGGMDTSGFPSDVKFKIDELGGNVSEHNDWGFAGRLFAGYLWHARQFQYGLELGGMKYPDNKYHLTIDLPVPAPMTDVVTVDMKYKGYLVDLLGVVRYFFASKWNLFLKEGVACTHQKFQAKIVDDDSVTGLHSETISRSRNKLLLELAAGIGYRILPRAELSLTYNHVFGNELSLDSTSARSKVASVDGLMLGASWFFG